MYSESVLNSSHVYDVIETSKEVLAGLKMMLTFFSPVNGIFLIPLSKKHY